MAKIAVTEQRVFRVQTCPDNAYDFFSRPGRFCEAMEGVEQCEMLSEGKVRWVFEEKREQGICFRADYVVAFEGDGRRHVRWRFIEGNVENEGDVEIVPLPDGTSEIHYRETVAPDLPITPLTARLIKPLVMRELRNDLGRFVQRAQECLSV